MSILVAASQHGIEEKDPKKARAAYAAATRAQQAIHGSATGIANRFVKFERVLNAGHRLLQVDVGAKFPLASLLEATELIKQFAIATAPHPNWADMKMAKSELSLPPSGHAFVWWRKYMRYPGQWQDMFTLARLWHLTNAKDIDTFKRLARKMTPTKDPEGRTVILRCPPWALP